jgi:hypothetical protein
MVKFILWITMCIDGTCSYLNANFKTARECQEASKDVLTIMQENNIEDFVIYCEKKKSIPS